VKRRHPQPARAARYVAPFLCLCLLLPLAGCRRGETPPAADNAGAAANANAPATQAAAETRCGVPYYPVRAGLEKQYRVTYERNAAPAADYTEGYANIGPDSFTLRYQFPELSVSTGWNCTGEGMVALEYGNLDFARQSNNFKMETVGRTGVTVPAADRWREGGEWRSSYEIRTELAGPQGASGRGSGTIEITNRVVGRERVTVPAGTYDALKVESTMAMKLTVRVGQMTVPTNTNVRNTTWFAENVGMVRAVSAGGDFAGATTELVSLRR
jgi:hypothetical protein